MPDRRIYKYPLCRDPHLHDLQDIVSVPIHAGSTVLCVQVQNGIPCLWAEGDPTQPPLIRRFQLIGTGHPITSDESSRKYVGTIQLFEGRLVLHVFELL